MEKTDRKILSLLAADGRMSFTDLGKATGLSTSAVHQRVKRLEQRGMIRGYVATVDHEQMGLPLTAFVSITPIDPSEPDDYPDRLRSVAGDRVVLVGRRRRVLHPQGTGRHPQCARGPPRPHPLRRQRQLPHHHRPLHPLREPPGVVGGGVIPGRPGITDVRVGCNAREEAANDTEVERQAGLSARDSRILRIRRASRCGRARSSQVIRMQTQPVSAQISSSRRFSRSRNSLERLALAAHREVLQPAVDLAEDAVLRPTQSPRARRAARARRTPRPAAPGVECARARTGGRRETRPQTRSGDQRGAVPGRW